MPPQPLSLRLSLDDFVLTDGPTGVVVAPNESKHNFFRHLGLSQSNYMHQVLYEKMKKEAKGGMKRLFSDRESLRPNLTENTSIIPPFTLQQISELAFQRQVDTIYDSAVLKTKGLYSLVHTDDGNWVIRWMLWRAINAEQYRQRREASGGGSGGQIHIRPSASPVATDASNTTAQTQNTSSWLSNNDTLSTEISDFESMDEDEESATAARRAKMDQSAPPSRVSYWDPVVEA